MPPREKPQLHIFSFGDNLIARATVLAGLHNKSAREHNTDLIDPSSLCDTKSKISGKELTHQSDTNIYHHYFRSKENEQRSGAIMLHDGAIWVTDGEPPAEHLQILRVLHKTGAALLIFLVEPSNPKTKDKDELLDLIEDSLREICEEAGFTGDQLKIIRGAPGDAQSIQALYEACDQTFFPHDTRETSSSFWMRIEDVFVARYKNQIVVTGRVERGVVRVRDRLELLSRGERRPITVTNVESTFSRAKDFAEAGSNVALVVEGLPREELAWGQLLMAPGSLKVCSQFEAEVYFYPPEHGPKYPPEIGQSFRISCTKQEENCELLSGSVVSGGLSSVTLRTQFAIGVERLDRFLLIAENRSAGLGVITKLLK